MNQHLINHVDAWLDRAANFVTAYMPLDITTDMIYEELLQCSSSFTPEMVKAFREAVKYLPAQGQHKRLTFALPDKRNISIVVRLNATDKWPVFLMPSGDLTINPEGKFAALLDTPIQVATAWAELEFVWQQLRSPEHKLTDDQLVYLMPWLRECLADFDVVELPVEVKFAERKQIAKEHLAVMRDANVLVFPRMSKALMEVARSGRILISQYRMLDAAYGQEQLVRTPITIDRGISLVEPWVHEHFAEAMNEWVNDRNARYARQLQAIRLKEANKTNPKGK